jgi:hypothetical protein
MNAVGMWKVASYSFTSNATPFIDNCFTSDYENYKVVISVTSSANAVASFYFRTGGADVTTAAYYWGGFYINMAGAASLTAESSSTNVSQGRYGAFTTGGNNFAEINISRPKNAAQVTTYTSVHQSAEPFTRYISGYFNGTNSFDGIKIFGGTLTGTITVYGLRN